MFPRGQKRKKWNKNYLLTIGRCDKKCDLKLISLHFQANYSYSMRIFIFRARVTQLCAQPKFLASLQVHGNVFSFSALFWTFNKKRIKMIWLRALPILIISFAWGRCRTLVCLDKANSREKYEKCKETKAEVELLQVGCVSNREITISYAYASQTRQTTTALYKLWVIFSRYPEHISLAHARSPSHLRVPEKISLLTWRVSLSFHAWVMARKRYLWVSPYRHWRVIIFPFCLSWSLSSMCARYRARKRHTVFWG